ncbi:MAG: hypothetical protein PHU81_06405 [Acidobacteriota bacterium]|nr:hypothetical protein [Acidobacteriota bacterium]
MRKILVVLFLVGNLIVANNKAGAQGITEEQVKNFSYHLAYGEETVTLKNGEYEKGFPDYEHVRLHSFVIKDLNGDNEPDAVVILAQNSGGSGTFYEITALLSRGRDIVQTNSIYLGDRVRIEKLQAEEKAAFPPGSRSKVARIRLDLLTHKETDALCCPSKKESQCYILRENNLISCQEVASPGVREKAEAYLPTDRHEKVTESETAKPASKGFTVVEGGELAKGLDDESKSDTAQAYSFRPGETGILILRGIKAEENRLSIRINTGGCTEKKSIKAEVKKVEGIDPQVPAYEITFIKQTPDNCKGLFPEGVVIEYDLKMDFGFSMPYTITVKNPIIPLAKNEPYFIISSVRKEGPVEVKDNSSEQELEQNQIAQLKQELIEATVRAIEMEIERYKAYVRQDKKEKIAYLQTELDKFKKMKPEDYLLASTTENNLLANAGKFGPLLPPEEREIEIIVSKEYKYGSILEVSGMTRSGPFYHLAGIKGCDLKYLSPGQYKIKAYLVYKREYFGAIPDYYVYIAGKI